MFKTIYGIIFSVLLSACTAPQLTQNIQNNDWQAVGNYDGSNGIPERSKEKLQSLSTQLAAEDMNYQAYLNAYNPAVKMYCESQHAYVLGVTGAPYQGVCERFPHGVFFYRDYINGKKSTAGNIFK